MRGSIFWAVLALLVALVLPGRAEAHATLVRSDPPQGATLPVPPSTARLWFSEPLDPLFSSAELYDVYGMPLALPGPAHLAPGDQVELALPLPEALDAGTYTILWSVLSANDGHTTRGVLIFAVGSGAPETPQLPGAGVLEDAGGPHGLAVAIRALQYLGALLVAGGLSFGLLALRPVLQANEGASAVAGEQRLEARWRAILLSAHTLLLLATIATLVTQAAAASSLSMGQALLSDAPARLLLTRWGLLWLVRMGLAATLLPLIFFGALRRPAALWAALLVSLALLGTLSLSSHAAALAEGRGRAILADWLHLAAVAPWAGGVLLLALLSLQGPGGRWLEQARRLGHAFAPLALASVALLALTGAYSATRHLEAPGDLLRSSYGLALSAKLLLCALALALGAYHWRRGLRPGRRRTLAAEALLILALLVATAWLVQTPPPQQAAGQPVAVRTPEPYSHSQQAQDLRITLEVDALAVGVRTITARVEDQQGQPAGADRVLLRVRALDMEHGLQGQQMIEREPGHFQAQVAAISMRGRWEVSVVVRRRGLEDVTAAFQLDVF